MDAEALGMLKEAARTASATMRPELLFPVERIQNINDGRLELLTLDASRDLAAAVAAANAARSGGDPWRGRTG